ncbi:hypothetical protein ACJX0J_021707 [Zea mays]
MKKQHFGKAQIFQIFLSNTENIGPLISEIHFLSNMLNEQASWLGARCAYPQGPDTEHLGFLFPTAKNEYLQKGQGQASMNWTLTLHNVRILDSDSLLFVSAIGDIHFYFLNLCVLGNFGILLCLIYGVLATISVGLIPIVYTKLVVVDEWCHSEHPLNNKLWVTFHQYFITTIVIFLENERYNTCTKITIIHSRTFCYGDILLHRHHHFLTLNIC